MNHARSVSIGLNRMTFCTGAKPPASPSFHRRAEIRRSGVFQLAHNQNMLFMKCSESGVSTLSFE
eukprot:1161658-Pelagomonas_calceolata.AAC.4